MFICCAWPQGNGLVMQLPSEWASLTKLEVLDLSLNLMYGSAEGLPASWAAMTSLDILQLSGNPLAGTPATSNDTYHSVTIPADWFRNSSAGPGMTNLGVLSCADCGLSGSLEWLTTLPPTIVWLELHNNSFTGSLPEGAAEDCQRWCRLTIHVCLAAAWQLPPPTPQRW
jgi:hypothetical protein